MSFEATHEDIFAADIESSVENCLDNDISLKSNRENGLVDEDISLEDDNEKRTNRNFILTLVSISFIILFSIFVFTNYSDHSVYIYDEGTVFVMNDPDCRSDQRELVLFNTTTKQKVKFTADGSKRKSREMGKGFDVNPHVSPDGKIIGFIRHFTEKQTRHMILADRKGKIIKDWTVNCSNFGFMKTKEEEEKDHFSWKKEFDHEPKLIPSGNSVYCVADDETVTMFDTTSGNVTKWKSFLLSGFNKFYNGTISEDGKVLFLIASKTAHNSAKIQLVKVDVEGVFKKDVQEIKSEVLVSSMKGFAVDFVPIEKDVG